MLPASDQPEAKRPGRCASQLVGSHRDVRFWANSGGRRRWNVTSWKHGFRPEEVISPATANVAGPCAAGIPPLVASLMKNADLHSSLRSPQPTVVRTSNSRTCRHVSALWYRLARYRNASALATFSWNTKIGNTKISQLVRK